MVAQQKTTINPKHNKTKSLQATFKKDIKQYEQAFHRSQNSVSYKYDYFYGPYDKQKHLLQQKKAQIDKTNPKRLPNIRILAKPNKDLFMNFEEEEDVIQFKEHDTEDLTQSFDNANQPKTEKF